MQEDASRLTSFSSRRTTLWLVALVCFGLLAVVAISEITTNLISDLERRSNNERARLSIGEHIIDTVRNIESAFFQLATTSFASRKRLLQQIDNNAQELATAIEVLQSGGIVKKRLALNIEGQDEMIRELSYTRETKSSAVVLEVIEISPYVDEIQRRARTLIATLEERDNCGLRNPAWRQATPRYNSSTRPSPRFSSGSMKTPTGCSSPATADFRNWRSATPASRATSGNCSSR